MLFLNFRYKVNRPYIILLIITGKCDIDTISVTAFNKVFKLNKFKSNYRTVDNLNICNCRVYLFVLV